MQVRGKIYITVIFSKIYDFFNTTQHDHLILFFVHIFYFTRLFCSHDPAGVRPPVRLPGQVRPRPRGGSRLHTLHRLLHAISDHGQVQPCSAV